MTTDLFDRYQVIDVDTAAAVSAAASSDANTSGAEGTAPADSDTVYVAQADANQQHQAEGLFADVRDRQLRRLGVPDEFLPLVRTIATDADDVDHTDHHFRGQWFDDLAVYWREFARPVPEPMYHGIWSASFRRDLKIEGNVLVLMQNLRNFTVQFELLRKVGVPV